MRDLAASLAENGPAVLNHMPNKDSLSRQIRRERSKTLGTQTLPKTNADFFKLEEQFTTTKDNGPFLRAVEYVDKGTV